MSRRQRTRLIIATGAAALGLLAFAPPAAASTTSQATGTDNITWSGSTQNITWSGSTQNITWSGSTQNITW